MTNYLLAVLIILSSVTAYPQVIFRGQNHGRIVSSPAIVSTTDCGQYDGTATCSVTMVAGDVLVAYTNTVDSTTAALVPSGCVTWTQQGTTDAYGDSLWTGPETSSGSCSVTAAGTEGAVILLWNVSGVVNTIDGTPKVGSYTAAADKLTSGPVTTTKGGDLILGACITGTKADTLTVASSFSSDSSGIINAVWPYGLGHLVQGTAGAVAPTWTTAANTLYLCGTIALEP